MNKPVKLSELVDEMVAQFEDWRTYLNVKTGEIIPISEEDLRAVEDEEEDYILGNKEVIVDILENSEDYIELPTKYEIDEYDMMENFCLTVHKERSMRLLQDAIKANKPFRRFKDMIERLGLREEWFSYRDECYKEIAKSWCQDWGAEWTE